MRIRAKMGGSARVVAWVYVILGVLTLITGLSRLGSDTQYAPGVVIGGVITGGPFLTGGAGILLRVRWAWWFSVTLTVLEIGALFVVAFTAREPLAGVIAAIFILALVGLVLGTGEPERAAVIRDSPGERSVSSPAASLPPPPVALTGPRPPFPPASNRRSRRPTTLVIIGAIAGMVLMGGAFWAGTLTQNGSGDAAPPALPAQDIEAISAMSAALGRFNEAATILVDDYRAGAFDPQLWFGTTRNTMRDALFGMEAEAARIQDPDAGRLAKRLVAVVGREFSALYDLQGAALRSCHSSDNPYDIIICRATLGERKIEKNERMALRRLRRAAAERARLVEEFLRFLER